MYYILVSIIAYLFGSIPFAYLIVKLFTGRDIRTIGSGNMGTLNTFRTIKESKGIKLAAIGSLLVLIGDMGKAVLAIFSAQKLFNLSNLFFNSYYIFLILAAAFVVIGHNWPVWLKFKGGRGAACLMGIFLYLDPLSLIVWGIPILIVSIITELILEKKAILKISQLFLAIGTQMLGRVIGIALGLVLLYFYNFQIFSIAFIPVILLLIKNIDRVKKYLQELRAKKINNQNKLK